MSYALKILQTLSWCMKVDNFDALKVHEVKVQLALSFRALLKILLKTLSSDDLGIPYLSCIRIVHWLVGFALYLTASS